MIDDKVKKMRETMKCGWDDADLVCVSDQDEKKPAPPVMLSPLCPEKLIHLPSPDEAEVRDLDFLQLVRSRRSRRVYKAEAMTLAQLSCLLYCTQGYERPRPGQTSYAALRTVPSAGCRHPFDTYLSVMNVEGLESGIYRFLPKEHALEPVRAVPAKELRSMTAAACCDQGFCGRSAVTFFWAANMYRSEWRYPSGAHKIVLLDAGHVCQNLYMACEALGLGTCAIGAFDQDYCDEMLGLDGTDVFTLYAAPVGVPRD